MKNKIPLCIPYIDNEDINGVVEVLKTGWFAHGPKNIEFEKKFKEYIGVEHAISMNSCTAALFLALLANNIKGEVILPSFTFVASANAVITAGAVPVFADIEYDTCNIDPDKIEELITPQTEAIMVVHYGGSVCNMDKILKIANKHNLLIIEDSAETLGGTYKNRKSGSFGDVGCYSFFPTKNITTGEGGMLTTNNSGIAQKVRALLAHGIDSTTYDRENQNKKWYRSAYYPGYNFRLSNILACLGVTQLDKIELLNEKRIQIANKYLRRLQNVKNIKITIPGPEVKSVYQMFTIKVKKNIRDKVVSELNVRNIGASVHFDPPVHRQYFYKNKYNFEDLKVTEEVASTIISLPIYPSMNLKEVDFVCDNIIDVLLRD